MRWEGEGGGLPASRAIRPGDPPGVHARKPTIRSTLRPFVREALLEIGRIASLAHVRAHICMHALSKRTHGSAGTLLSIHTGFGDDWSPGSGGWKCAIVGAP